MDEPLRAITKVMGYWEHRVPSDDSLQCPARSGKDEHTRASVPLLLHVEPSRDFTKLIQFQRLRQPVLVKAQRRNQRGAVVEFRG